MKIFNLLSLSFVILLSISCAKDGEQGPAGPQGPAGQQGATGPQGPAGANGNANVYSYKFSVPLSNFIGPQLNNAWQYVFSPTTVMGLNTFISDKDVILMYLYEQTTGGTDYYNAMPFNDYFNTGTAFNQHSFQIGATGPANFILIEIRNSTGVQPYTSMTTGDLYYKMVYIKSTNKVKPSLPNSLDYASVKAYYNLKD